MAGYTFLPDIAIADIAFEATGKDLEEVFTQAALAFADIQANLATVDDTATHDIELEHEELDRLLFDFLQELVFIKDTDSFIPKRFEIKI